MASSTFLLFLFALYSVVFLASSSEEKRPLTITLPLNPTITRKPWADPVVFLQELASASMSRAHRLKYGKHNPGPSLIKAPIYPNDYGGHTVPLSFGTPPQRLSYLVDTGSNVVWAPCTHYKCINCSFSHIAIFKPELSSSSKNLGCKSPRCTTGCPSCKPKSKNCSLDCTYVLQYGSGAEGGHFLLEDLHFPGKTVHDFALGCTTIAVGEISTYAMAGFGRSSYSLPVQLGVKKFSYCLNSHYFDGTANSSSLIFDYRDGDTKGLSYTPFLKNPPDWPIYYYLGVKSIMLGDKLLPIPSKYLAPGTNGSGGVMIDSGFSFGYMAGPVYEIVSNEVKRQMLKYKRSGEAERELGVAPCYKLTRTLKVPDLIFHFTGGATMVVPGNRYFYFSPEMHVGCFPVTTDADKTLQFTPGPSIIVGNYMQVNHYIEFDLKNERLGFRQQIC